jgi:hypothetical protein
VLHLNQQEATLEYDPDPTNAVWLDGEEGADHTRAFVTELLIPVEALHVEMGMTPFMMAMPLFEKWPAFAEQQAQRRSWNTDAAPVLARLKNHLEKRHRDVFATDAAKFGRVCAEEATDLQRLHLIAELDRVPGNLLALPREAWFDRIQQRVAYSWAKDKTLFQTFIQESESKGRSEQLWHELASLSDLLTRCYSFITPLLQPSYWKSKPEDLSGFVVCDKRFVELKQLYVDAFETTCRLSTIAIALEAIIFHGSLALPTKKGSISVWEYDALPNAGKSHFLEPFPISDLFVPFMSTNLRNGIGHNTARYDSSRDEVVWNTKSKQKHQLGYAEFCSQVLEAVSTLVHVQEYYFATALRAGALPI